MNERLLLNKTRFLAAIDESLKTTVLWGESQGTETTVVADVHTGKNTRQILEEDLAYVDLIVVSAK